MTIKANLQNLKRHLSCFFMSMETSLNSRTFIVNQTCRLSNEYVTEAFCQFVKNFIQEKNIRDAIVWYKFNRSSRAAIRALKKLRTKEK